MREATKLMARLATDDARAGALADIRRALEEGGVISRAAQELGIATSTFNKIRRDDAGVEALCSEVPRRKLPPGRKIGSKCGPYRKHTRPGRRKKASC